MAPVPIIPTRKESSPRWLKVLAESTPLIIAVGVQASTSPSVQQSSSCKALYNEYSIMSNRRSLPALLLAAIAIVAGCHKGPPAGVAATVNNHPITYADLEKNYKMQPMANPEGISEDEIQIQKLDLLGKLIEAEIMLQRAEKLGLLVTDADVEAKYNELKAPYTIEEFNKQLASRHMTWGDLKPQRRK